MDPRPGRLSATFDAVGGYRFAVVLQLTM